uniref:Uncharacterized protein n=1 Tax=Sphaerodactylus townsendi TaxID=933632 RepID=A0ACB8FGN2_9SAUR
MQRATGQAASPALPLQAPQPEQEAADSTSSLHRLGRDKLQAGLTKRVSRGCSRAPPPRGSHGGSSDRPAPREEALRPMGGGTGRDPEARRLFSRQIKQPSVEKPEQKLWGPWADQMSVIQICIFWMKCPLASTNKRFLINTIKNTLQSAKEPDQDEKHTENDKESEPSLSREETKPKKYRMHPYTPSFRARKRVSYSPPRRQNGNRHTREKYEKQSGK